MKKTFSILTAFAIFFTFLLSITVSAASAGANLQGPSTVRAGDTITLNFNLNGSGIYGASGTLSYDSNQVTLTGTSQKIGSPWAVEFNGNNFVAYDNNLSNPINSNTTLFSVTFKVNSLPAGTNIKISFTGVTASDGSADASVGTVAYSTTLAAPLSTDNSLSGIAVNGVTISPAFSPSTVNYTAEVPFEVSKLNISATASDPKAKVSISNPSLVANGTTKVTITVTAENGAKKKYTISVKRAKDPNYIPSANNALSAITVDGFLLSPVFNTETTNYVVWLPYETTSVRVSGTPSDSKASVEVVGGDNLLAGQDNPVKIICTAENGEKREYTVVAKRAAAHDGSIDQPQNEPITDSSDDNTDVTQSPSEEVKGGIAWWWLLIVGGLSLALGIFGGYFGRNFLKKISKQ